jgi:PAS domain S-box-containing protein
MLGNSRQRLDVRSETEFHRLLEALPVGAYTCDRTGSITFYNTRAAQLWGRAPRLNDPSDRFCGSFRQYSLAGDPIAPEQCWMARALLDNRDYCGNEVVIERPDGSRRTVLVHARPLHNEAGELSSAVNILIDITRRERLESEHALLTAIVEFSDDAIYSRSIDGRILSWNAGAERLYGFTSSEAIGSPVSLLVPREKREEEEAIVARLCRGDRVATYETVQVTRHGRIVDVAVQMSPIVDSEGRIIGASYVVRDITERKRSENALRESEQRFAKFMQHLPGLAWIKDINGRYVFVNEAAARAFRLSRESLLGKSDDEVFPKETAARFRRNDSMALASGGIETVETLEHDDGIHYSIVHKFPIAGPDGSPVFVGGMAVDFTERLRAEEALRASEERFRALANHAPVGIILTDLFGSCTFINGRWCELAGLTSEQALGNGWLTVVHPDDRERLEREWETAQKDRRPYVSEIRFLKSDGTIKWLQWSAAELLDAQDALAGYIVTVVDRTERHHFEEESRNARNQLKLVTDTMSAAVTRCSADLRYVWVSPSYAAWLRRAPAEIAGQPIVEILGPDEYQTIRPYIERVLAGERVEYEAQLTYGDACQKWVQATYVPTFGENNRPDGWVAVVNDITRLKEAESALASQITDLRRLHEMNERLATMVELQPILEEVLHTAVALDGTETGLLLLIDSKSGQFQLRARLGFADFLFNSNESILPGQSVFESCRRERARVVVEEVQADPLFKPHRGKPQSLGFRAVHATPLITRGGKLVGVLATHFREPHRPTDRETHLIDLCARSAADHIENAQLYEELRQADRRKDEFLAILAHELRSPLAPIRNSLNILQMSEELSPSTESVREIMDRQVTHLVRLVDDLLDVSRITQGKIQLQKTSVDIADVIRCAVESSQPLIDEFNHQLTISLPPETMLLEGDLLRLAQIVTNLLNNAAKYMDPGGRIWLTATRRANEAAISVRDAGIGIPPDSLPHIFDMFAQAQGSLRRAQGGLGIGLTLAMRLANLHGGRIEAFSNGAGKGSEFIIHLPMQSVPPGTSHSTAGSICQSSPVRGTLPSLRILVVDDARASAVTLARLLESMGQAVWCANDAKSALEIARREQPDIVFSDIAMPAMDGFELAFHLRQDPKLQRVFLVALTGYGQESDRERTRSAGFDQHVVKPVSLECLNDLLVSFTNRKRPELPMRTETLRIRAH